jgi:hypothetical protein|tara:strand:+ start:314 stop:1027 length:714 start_codon:yes stop_codon:yes gene_type:complete
MATSGTTAFDLDIDEIIQEAYERCGMTARTGYGLKSARRSLNILFSEWGNRGLHLWKIDLAAVPLVEGQAEYNATTDSTNFPGNVNEILEAYVRNNTTATAPVDTPISKIDRSSYSAIANKLSKGTPSQYYVDRTTSPSIFLYQTPSSSFSGSNFLLKFYYLKRIEDAGAYTNQTDIVYRFIPCMCAGLSYYLSLKIAPDRSQNLKLLYEDELTRALNEDSSSTSTFLTPKVYFPTT